MCLTVAEELLHDGKPYPPSGAIALVDDVLEVDGDGAEQTQAGRAQVAISEVTWLSRV
jgi:hypothetical protein